MNSDEARRALQRGTPAEARAAARWLARRASPGDSDFIQRAIADRPDHWVLTALREAAGLILETPAAAPAVVGDLPDDPAIAAADAYARGLRDTTTTLVHELRRFVGFSKLSAGDLSSAYEGSELQADLDRLSGLLDAIETLGTAARTPRTEQFDLSELLIDIAARESRDFGVRVSARGPRPLMLEGDLRLVELAACATVRNACEATLDTGVEGPRPIVVSWNSTERDYWFAVIDSGVGPPKSLLDPFEFAATTKPTSDHLGVGLALTRRVADTLGGSVGLRSNDPHGATLEFRWPRAGLSHANPPR